MNVLQKIKDAFSNVGPDEELNDTRELLEKTKMRRQEESIKRKRELVKVNEAAGNYREVARLKKEIEQGINVVHREEDFLSGLGIDIEEDVE